MKLRKTFIALLAATMATAVLPGLAAFAKASGRTASLLETATVTFGAEEPGPTPAQAEPASGSSGHSGSLHVENYELFLDFSVAGGTIVTAEGDEWQTRYNITGTVRPGETITVSGTGLCTPYGEDSLNKGLGSTIIAVVDASPRANTEASHDAFEEKKLDDGESGSVSASLVVTEGIRTVTATLNLTRTWENMNGVFTKSQIVTAVFDVTQPEPTPILPGGLMGTPSPPPYSPSPSAPTASPEAPLQPVDAPQQNIPGFTSGGGDTAGGWIAAAASISALSALIAAISFVAGGAGAPPAAGPVPPAAGAPPAPAETMAGKVGKALEEATETVVSGLGTLDSIFTVLGVKDRLNNLIDACADQAFVQRQMWRWYDYTGEEALKMSAVRGYLANVRMGRKLSDAIDTYNNTMSYIGIGMDAWENTKSVDGEGGVLIEGDGWIKGIGKSVAVNYIMDAILEKNPGVAIMEACNSLFLGGTEAGDVISPVTTMKGAFNMLIDTVQSELEGSDTAYARARAGVYGPNIQNLSYGMDMAGEAVYDSETFIKDFSNVVSDKDWYENMYDTAGSMWRDEHGNLTMVGKVAEPVTQMGVAMTETVAGMARAAGTVTEYGIQKLRNFFAW
ncbi:MAG: hypothetical protein ACOX8O_01170 [Christensenellales bacterium]|jgi:hypothetical protein